MTGIASPGRIFPRLGFLLALAAGLMLAACSGASDTAAETSAEEGGFSWAPETFTLDNGMEVVVLPDHRVPVVTHMVWYRVGSADENPGESGIAHFLEHLLFKGTERFGPGEFSRLVTANGGVDNAFTSYDYTAYYQRIALDRLEMFMDMEADRMTGLVLPDEEFYSERDVVLEELRIAQQDIGRVIDIAMERELNPVHPYGIPVVGWIEEVGALEPDQVMAFYNRFYRPNNAILVVAGDITAEELRPMAERTYGQVEPLYVEERVRPENPEGLGSRRIAFEHELAGERYFYRYYSAPSYLTGGNELGATLSVGMSILDGGTTEWLYRELVIERGLATTAGAWYLGGAHDHGEIGIYAIPVEGVGFAELETAVDEVIAQYLAEGPTEEQITRTQTGMVSSAIYAQDDQASMAQLFGRNLAVGRTVEDIMSWPESVEAVTAEGIRTALADVLVMENSVTGNISPVSVPAVPEDAKSDATGMEEGSPEHANTAEKEG